MDGMTDTIRDQYTDPVPLVSGGENVLVRNEDGSLQLKEKEPEERPVMKGRQKFAVEHARDDMIERMTETDLGVYYRVGNKVTVRGGRGGHWLCLTCQGRDRYELGDHEGCVHIQRVKRWVADHQAAA